MESNKAPVHDFAPAWLKIPDTQKSKKSLAANVNALPLEDNYSFRPKYLENDLKLKLNNNNNSFNSNNINFNTSKLASSDLQENCEQAKLYNDKIFLESSLIKEHQNKQLNGGNFISNHINNSSSDNLNRRYFKPKLDANRRPHSRHDFRDATSFHHSKSGNNFDYNHPITSAAAVSSSLSSSTVSTTYSVQASATKTSDSSPAPLLNKDTLFEHAKLSKSKKPVVIDSNTEFPSLVDDNVNLNKSNRSIWDNAKSVVLKNGPRSSFTVLHKQTVNQDNSVNNDVSSSPSTSASNQVLNSNQSPPVTVSAQQRNSVDNSNSYYHQSFVSVSKRKSSNSLKDNMSVANKNSKWLPLISGGTTDSSLSTMEILVRNPKIRSNKSEFLRALRSESSNGKSESKDSGSNYKDEEMSERKVDKQVQEGEHSSKENSEVERNLNNNRIENDNDKTASKIMKNNDNVNNNSCNNNNDDSKDDKGINITKLVISDSNSVDTNGVRLSSSLEAEERLLKAMGWKENDDDDNFCAPLTEDEVKEFKDLIMSRNGFEKYKNLASQHVYHINNNNKSSQRLLNSNNNRNSLQFQFNRNSKYNLNRVNGFVSSPEIMDDTTSSSDDDDDDDDDDIKMIV